MTRKLQACLENMKKEEKALYHYSNKYYKDLRSLRAQGRLSAKELNKLDNEYTRDQDLRPYTEQISLFIEPIPTKIIGDLFNNDHHTWYNDHELYEYKIPYNNLEEDIPYLLTETKQDTELLDKYYSKTMSPSAFQDYIKLKYSIKADNKQIGEGRDNLIKAIEPYLGTTEQYFINARKRYDAEQTKDQYAATVPHLMVYPSLGVIDYESYRKVIIGKYS